MKKTLLISISMLSLGLNAQRYIQSTEYRGAFAPSPAVQWTDKWTNFDPQNTNYNQSNKTVIDVNQDITSNTTWSSDKIYLLKKPIFVTGNSTLTIEPGTVIFGDKGATGAALFITRGSKLNAEGTADAPIVFTSNQAVGSRTKGDWGGLVILGKAKNNQNENNVKTYIEGLVADENSQHGGSDDTDNSGVLKFVRIEFGGYVYQPNKEINGITFGSVGSGTTVENIQVSYANDDAFEWFGGTVNCKNLVSFRNLDDDFDTDFGYSGQVQFGLAVRDPQMADDPTVSSYEGFESDNDANGSSLTPITSATFSNITLVGPYRGDLSSSVASGYRRGARIRRNSQLKIYNSIFLDYQRGLHIDGTACETNANNGTLKFFNNIIAGIQSAGKIGEVNSGSLFDVKKYLADKKNDTTYTTSGASILTDYHSSLTSSDFRPSANSLALSNANFHDSLFIKVAALNNLTNKSIPVRIYPNPVNSEMNLEFTLEQSNTNVKVELLSISGQLVKSIYNNPNASSLITINSSISSIENGTYLIKISSNEDAYFHKILIQK